MSKRANTTTISSSHASQGVLNDNFEAINTALENTVSLDGSTPNTMTGDLDMGSNDIINIENITVTSMTINGVGVTPSSIAATPAASSITITDSGGHFSSGNVEGSLQEVGVIVKDQAVTNLIGLTPTDGVFLVGDGTNWVGESTTTAQTSLGISSFAQTLLDDADASAVLTTLGISGSASPESALIGSTISVTGSGSNWIFSGFDDDTYYKYRIILKKNQFEVALEDGVGLGLRVSTDDQSTWVKTNEYDYSVVENGGSATAASNTNYARLCNNSANGTVAESIWGYIDIEGTGSNHVVIKSVISIGEDTYESTSSVTTTAPITDLNLFDLRGSLPVDDGPVAGTGLTFAADVRGYLI